MSHQVHSFPEILEKRLYKLEQLGCYRELSHRQGLDFSSNDYLGFSQDEPLKMRVLSQLEKFPLGSSASRLLRGHLDVFEKVEEELADFCSREASVVYASGYQANVGLLSAILTSEDTVFSDQYNHASIIDGIRLSGAKKAIFRHGDGKDLRRLLEVHRHERGLKVIVTESFFGMDGDRTPLLQWADLAEEFSALLIVDEAHATGIWGDFQQNKGGGLVQALGLSSRVFATIHPAGKAFGVGGAWVCGDTRLKEFLVNCSRPLIYSTAPMPALAVALDETVDYWKKVGQGRAETVLTRAENFRRNISHLQENKVFEIRGEGLIIPIIIGENLRTLKVAESLRESGFDVRAIRPPTVPSGSARLRVTVNWHQAESELERFVLSLATALSQAESEKE